VHNCSEVTVLVEFVVAAAVQRPPFGLTPNWKRVGDSSDVGVGAGDIGAAPILLASGQLGDVFIDVGDPSDSDADLIGRVRCFAATAGVFCFCMLLPTDVSHSITAMIVPVLPGVFAGRFVGAGVPPSDAGRRVLITPPRADLDRAANDVAVVFDNDFLLPTVAECAVVLVTYDALASVLKLHVATLSHEAASVVDPARRPPPAPRGIAPLQVGIVESHPAGAPPPSIPMRFVADTARRLMAAVGRRRTTDDDDNGDNMQLGISTLS